VSGRRRAAWAPALAAAVIALGLGGLAAQSAGPNASDADDWVWDLPAGTPLPIVPEDNPMTHAKVELGRHLFYDPRLSENGTQSCATCHEQARAFADGRDRALGSTGEVHPRSSMSLANVAYASVLTWANPNLTLLEDQALGPIFGDDPVEMGMAGKEAELLRRLAESEVYPALFTRAFPGEPEPISLVTLTRALSAFQRSLISLDSPYDRNLRGDGGAIGADARVGEFLFLGERLQCFRCHGGRFFSSSTDYVGKTFVQPAFFNIGLYNLDGRGAYPERNTGVHAVTKNARDMGSFRAPTLRNVAVTAPYMHDGSVATLDDVIDHYAAGGRTIRSGPLAGVGRASPLRSPFMGGFELTAAERRGLIAFLESLTDERFLTDPRHANPWPSGEVR